MSESSVHELRGWLLRPARVGLGVRLALGVVRVEGERIVEVVEDASAVRGADLARVISPAFSDAHVHLSQFGVIGAHGLELLDWLAGCVFPAELRWADEAYARRSAERAAEVLLSVGTVGVGAYATVHTPGAAAALEVLSGLGMRGVVGPVLMDGNAPAGLTPEVGAQLEGCAGLLEAWPAGGRLSAAVTPRFAVSCSAELLAGAGALAAERGAVVQTHLAETVRECTAVAERFSGASYVEVYARAGLLRRGALLGHGIYLGEADRAALRAAGAVVAHCPTANDFLGAGAMGWAEHASAGVGLALGSDVGAGFERSMVRVARAMLLTAARRGGAVPTAAEAWWWITAGNAAALRAGVVETGHGDRLAGVLEVGASADVVVIEPAAATGWREREDPLAALLWGWDDRWLVATMAAGQTRFMRNG